MEREELNARSVLKKPKQVNRIDQSIIIAYLLAKRDGIISILTNLNPTET